MNHRKVILFFLCCFLAAFSFAQNYWQQQVNYKIDVKLDDVKHELNGFVEMEYYNGSPNDLDFIYIHLYPNAYKNHNTAFAKQMLEIGKTDFYFSKPDERGYIDQLDFKVNNQPVRWELDSVNIDICKIIFSVPMRSGTVITISTPFHIKIPKTFSRLGHEGQSYQITQWYPKPAVYDKDGWHPMPYLDMGEYYSEYGSFDVKITLPKNYVVGATGDLQNEDEIKFLEEKSKQTALLRDSLLEPDEANDTFPISSPEMKTLHYKQNYIHDFAWFADKRYNVLRGEVEMPDSKRKVTTWTMFTNEDFDFWKKSIEYINDGVLFYSKTVGEYPYNHCTAVQGALNAGGGMEYPNVTVIGNVKNDVALEAVIVHEVGHNWFYGIFGTNERRNPWMDEGINTYYENRYFNTKYENQHIILQDFADVPIPKFYHIHTPDVNEYPYLLQANRHIDQPMNLPSENYTDANYWSIVYAKTALMINYLRASLTTMVFDRVMHTYFDGWKFRHPQPDDFRKLFEKETGKELDWFFNDILPTTNEVDFKIKAIKDTVMIGKSVFRKITIKNTGKVRSPYSLAAMKNDEPFYVLWYGGFNGEMDVLFPEGKYDAFKINVPIDIPEGTRQNNTMRTRGLFKKLEPIVFQPFIDYDSPDYTEIYWSPAVGWNQYDNLMAGFALYSNFLRPRNFEYALVPMFGIPFGGVGSNTVTGTGRLSYYFYQKKGFLHHINFAVNGSLFTFNDNLQQFRKIAPELNFELRKKNPKSRVLQNIKLRSVYVGLDDENYDGSYKLNDYLVNELVYSMKNSRTINKYDFKLTVHQGDKLLKTFMEINYRLLDYDKRKGLDARIFGGIMQQNDVSKFDSRFMLGSGYYYDSGLKIKNGDYLLDDVYLGRSETKGILSQQVALNNGGFKVNTITGLSNDWVGTINLKSGLPGKIPLELFFDAAFFPDYDSKGNKVFGTAMEGGLTLDLGILFDAPDIFQIHLPLYLSGKIRDDEYVLNKSKIERDKNGVDILTTERKNILEKLTFTINFNKLIPFNYARNYGL